MCVWCVCVCLVFNKKKKTIRHNYGRGIAKKGGLEQFVDLRGGLVKGSGWCFWVFEWWVTGRGATRVDNLSYVLCTLCPIYNFNWKTPAITYIWNIYNIIQRISCSTSSKTTLLHSVFTLFPCTSVTTSLNNLT